MSAISSTAPRTPEKAIDPVQKLVEQNTTPAKTYALATDENGWISLKLTPGAKKQARVIYMFRRKSDKAVLIGKTETTVAKRTSGYVSSFNHPNTAKGTLALPEAVRENPADFEFGILCQSPDDVDLSALERAYIKAKDAIKTGFNQRAGGGGSSRRKKNKPDPEKVKSVCKTLFSQFSSPQKKPIQKTNRGYKVALPQDEKKAKNVIYVFKNSVTNERYVGKTIRELNKRISEHCHFATHQEKEAAKAPLYEAIRKDHKSISVGVLYQVPEEEEGMIEEIEKAFIQHYNSVQEGYNRNGDGATL